MRIISAKMLIFTIGIYCVSFASDSHAGSQGAYHCDTAQVFFASKHFSNDRFNEKNPGAAIECGSIGIGAVRNSEERESLVAYYKIPIDNYGNFRYGATLGLVTGYSYANVVPAASIYASISIAKNLFISASFIPGIKTEYDYKWNQEAEYKGFDSVNVILFSVTAIIER